MYPSTWTFLFNTIFKMFLGIFIWILKLSSWFLPTTTATKKFHYNFGVTLNLFQINFYKIDMLTMLKLLTYGHIYLSIYFRCFSFISEMFHNFWCVDLVHIFLNLSFSEHLPYVRTCGKNKDFIQFISLLYTCHIYEAVSEVIILYVNSLFESLGKRSMTTS